MADKEKQEAMQEEEVKETAEASKEQATEPGDKEAAPKEKKKSKILGKKDKQEEKIKELEDKALRQMAEFENFRKRSEKEKSQMYDMGAKSVIEKILPVIDNFERGLATLSEEQKKEPFADGMDKIYQQLMKELEGIGVTAIEAVGKEFDPNLHNAVMQTQSEEYESGVVASELQKGYMYHETVVRHSMVAVVE